MSRSHALRLLPSNTDAEISPRFRRSEFAREQPASSDTGGPK